MAVAEGTTPKLHEAFQQIFQLANLGVHGEGGVREIVDGHGQEAIVTEAKKLGDNAAVFDFTLADADLELPRAAAGVAQVNVANVREQIVVGGALPRAGPA